MDILQWALANGCHTGGADMSMYAATAGHLSIVQWLHENGYPWDKRTCVMAAREGHFDVLYWAWAHGCPCCKLALDLARVNDQPDIAQWIEANVHLPA